MKVSGPVPRSMVVPEPISTSSSMDDAAELRDLDVPVAPQREAEPVLPDMHAAMDQHAVADERVRERRIGGRHANARR